MMTTTVLSLTEPETMTTTSGMMEEGDGDGDDHGGDDDDVAAGGGGDGGYDDEGDVTSFLIPGHGFCLASSFNAHGCPAPTQDENPLM